MNQGPTSNALVVKEINGFVLLRELGQGGMGKVYLARQESLDRKIALKILLPELTNDVEFLARFQREAKSAALFHHPNITVVIDAGQDPRSGVHYIAFEYLAGGSLEDVLKKKGTLQEGQVLHVLKAVVAGLRYAEGQGLVHRDIKPDNILFDERGTPKLADLGLARRYDAEQPSKQVTQTGVVLGTPVYMAPEQALGEKDLDIRADIYALGLCAWRCLTGVVPFDEDRTASALQILSRHINQDLPDVRGHAPAVSDRLALLILGMTNRDRDARYPSTVALAQDIDRVVAGQLPEGPAGDPAVLTTRVELASVPPAEGGDGRAVTRAAVTGAHRASSASGRILEAVKEGPNMAVAAAVLIAALALGVGLAAVAGGKNKGRSHPRDLASRVPSQPATPDPSTQPTPESTPEPSTRPTPEATPEPSTKPTPEASALPTPGPSAQPTPPEQPAIPTSAVDRPYRALRRALFSDVAEAQRLHGKLAELKGPAEYWPAPERRALIDLIHVSGATIELLNEPRHEVANELLGNELGRLWQERFGESSPHRALADAQGEAKARSQREMADELKGKSWPSHLSRETHGAVEALDQFLADAFFLIAVRKALQQAAIQRHTFTVATQKLLLLIPAFGGHPLQTQARHMLTVLEQLHGLTLPNARWETRDLGRALSELPRHVPGALGTMLAREFAQLRLLGQMLQNRAPGDSPSQVVGWSLAHKAWTEELGKTGETPQPSDLLVAWIRPGEQDRALRARGVALLIDGAELSRSESEEGVALVAEPRILSPQPRIILAVGPRGLMVPVESEGVGRRRQQRQRLLAPPPRGQFLVVVENTATDLLVHVFDYVQDGKLVYETHIEGSLNSLTTVKARGDSLKQATVLLAPGLPGQLEGEGEPLRERVARPRRR